MNDLGNDIDFGSQGTNTGSIANDTEPKVTINSSKPDDINGKPAVDDITGNNPPDDNQSQANVTNNGTSAKENDDDNKANNGGSNNTTETNSSTGELTEGTVIEFDGAKYTVNKDGAIVDKDGAIFKSVKEAKEWLSTMDVDNGNDNNKSTEDFDFNSIREAIGVDIEDENGNPVEFTNDAKGIKSYIDSIIELKTKETQEAAINRLYQDKPYLKQVDDYYIANGGSLRGFGQLPDRSGIQLDKDNFQQLEYIIKASAEEFGNKSLDDKYIKYLKDTGSLYDVAKEQLALLVEKDSQTRAAYETRAKEIKAKEQEEVMNYWNNVNAAISTGTIGGYKIPETFVKEIDGKKVSLTRKDFYDYLSKPIKDKDGHNITAYQRDLNALSDKDYLDKELIDAFLTFTGGSYKDLIDMAIKEEQVRTLRIKAKDARANKTVRIKPKQSGKVDFNDIVL